MKRILTSSLFILASSFLAAFGAANDTLISFSTPGPDKYADGSTVKDGECYALVWTKTGATFAGLAADGTAVGDDSEVLVYAPVAKGGRCPTVVFELDADLAAKYEGGSFGVYLLDTRLANGKVGGVNANGLPVAVNGYGEVKGTGEGEQSNGSSSIVDLQPSASASSIAVTTKSALPANAPQPQITSIRVVGANVVLTVKNTLPCLQYAAQEVKVKGEGEGEGEGEGDSVNLNLQPQPSSVAQGAATVDEEITIIAPKKGDSGFYTVGRE